MGSIHSTTVRDRGCRRSGPVPEPLREIVPERPQPITAELGAFSPLTIKTILFGDDWRRKPLVVGRKLELGAALLVTGTGDGVSAFDGRSESGRGIGDGVVETFVDGGAGHGGEPARVAGGASLEDTSYEPWMGEKRRLLPTNAAAATVIKGFLRCFYSALLSTL